MAQTPAIQIRKFRRGELIFEPGPSSGCIFIVQSGWVSVCILKDGCTQLHLVGPWQTLREDALLAGPASGATAVALKETQVLEVPVELIRTQAGSVQAPLGLLFKSLLERHKAASNELRSYRVNRGAQPCPPDLTAKAFGVIFYSARYLGRKEGDAVLVQWSALRTYAIEVFHEDETRLEEAIYVLIKLGYAEPRTDQPQSVPEIPLSDRWERICFRNMAQIETFFDFYQNYHFKSGHGGLLKTNDKVTQLTQALVQLAEKHKADRAGMVTMPYKSTVDALKERFGKTFEADQIFRLEQKGLSIKRTATQDGGVLSFFKSEFEQMLLNWKVLREVEKWNEKGLVELPAIMANEGAALGVAPVAQKENPQLQSALSAVDTWKPLVLSGGTPQIRTDPPRPDENLCPVCLTPVQGSQTYCLICDSEIPKKAA